MGGSVVVVGGTSGLGREIAAYYAAQGRSVVVTGRDEERAAKVAAEIGGETSSAALDLSEPEGIEEALTGVDGVQHLVIAAIERDENTVADYDVARAKNLAILKLVGYTEVVHVLAPRMDEDGSIVLFGGLAKDRPYPGSTTVTTVNGAVTTMIHTLAIELAPIRVNAIHPAIVGDSPYWSGKPDHVLEGFRSRTPLGRLVAMEDIVHATAFLLENRSVTGVNLRVDGGWLIELDGSWQTADVAESPCLSGDFAGRSDENQLVRLPSRGKGSGHDGLRGSTLRSHRSHLSGTERRSHLPTTGMRLDWPPSAVCRPMPEATQSRFSVR